jgi:trehalose 6-phosphate synthase/phosphatase
MERLIIASNRLPLNIQAKKEDIQVIPSVGGLATGMKSVYKKYQSKWFGWPGFEKSEIDDQTQKEIEKILAQEKCHPVYFSREEKKLYYSGFSNKTIWPLFHYFLEYVHFEDLYWDTYVKVNEKFAEEMIQYIKPGDKIWIHDYHLMLLPKMIRDRVPEALIGYFLHIPFPSFELFRVLPWRREILEGLLGADLIGFHTYDYERHFLSSVRRLFGYNTYMNQIRMATRIAKTESFPMGIDYEKFYQASLESKKKTPDKQSALKTEIDKYYREGPDRKLILSIDRLDYSKGIPHRLRAYEHFLNKYPEYQGKVTLLMLAVPSRIHVEQYQAMKSEIDELVGRINGRYSYINWTPVWYFYRSLPFENLIELYHSCDVALITPVRDGMNLVAKEFIATRTDQSGVLILSQMAGAYKEMSETLNINPHNKNEIADTLKQALEMPADEQKEIITLLQQRIKRYDVKRWASEFIDALEAMSIIQKKYVSREITQADQKRILAAYQKAGKRVLFLDYDGTLVNLEKDHLKTRPDRELYQILDKLAHTRHTDVVLVTGRNKNYFDKWFALQKYILIAEHGIWIKKPGTEWQRTENTFLNNQWKQQVLPIVQAYTDRTPASRFEEKTHSLAWYYRNTDPDLALSRAVELKDELSSMTSNLQLEVIEGNKCLEIRNMTLNKGTAATAYLQENPADFVLAIGDDYTDEHLYEELPEFAVTIKVGIDKTLAKYHLTSFREARVLLKELTG